MLLVSVDMPIFFFLILVLVWAFFLLTLANDQESPQVEADREKSVGANNGGDGAEGGYTGEGDGAQEGEGEEHEEED